MAGREIGRRHCSPEALLLEIIANRQFFLRSINASGTMGALLACCRKNPDAPMCSLTVSANQTTCCVPPSRPRAPTRRQLGERMDSYEMAMEDFKQRARILLRSTEEAQKKAELAEMRNQLLIEQIERLQRGSYSPGIEVGFTRQFALQTSSASPSGALSQAFSPAHHTPSAHSLQVTPPPHRAPSPSPRTNVV